MTAVDGGVVQRVVFSVRIIRRMLVRAAVRSSSRVVMRARDVAFSELDSVGDLGTGEVSCREFART
ncbi:hypothetical protein [Streptomyces sp. NPDC050388]|uniref:hypothetical protein n=1 Tax=Streptomyces sp. NPDC050388 TaxID=3155781 RepID=UPI003434E72C